MIASAAPIDVPTIDSFLKGYEAVAWIGFGVPKGTPPEIVARLNKEVNAALADPKVSARMADLGWMGLILPEQYGGAGLDFVDLVVVLDHVTKPYRDSQLSTWLYGKGSGVFRRLGVARLVTAPGADSHRSYLERNGFHRVATAVRSSSDSCQISSTIPMSWALPFTVSVSSTRTRARSHGASASAVSADRMICSRFASAAIRAATLTESPYTSPSASIAGPT